MIVIEYDNNIQHFESRGTNKPENMADMRDLLCWIAQQIVETEHGKFSIMQTEMLLAETSATMNDVFREINNFNEN